MFRFKCLTLAQLRTFLVRFSVPQVAQKMECRVKSVSRASA